ncbi:MAG TPA: M56 family metallopeptidase [Rhizomicrobium sp.]|jgi:beta-lactamase regulating signal transducer with metallopeptidase domain|nr:M56 family metallopeptidase [Rhizomicrobium sp.]
MNSLFVLRALLFAGECLAASVLILGAAWLGSAHLKRASLRHLVWLGAFGALLVLPVAALIVPASIVLERTAAAPEPLPSFIEPAAAAADSAPAPTVVAMPAPAPAESWQPDMKDVVTLLFAVWLAGALWAVMRLALGTLGLVALRRQSRPHALASADMPRIGARRECELRLSICEDGPMTWGVLRPVILLPKESLSWPRERLQAVLLHELAHVHRRDSLTQSLALLVSALYWPNPLVWWASRALRREAEIAADDAAIVSGIKPSAYAGELVKLASEFRGRNLAFSGVSMAGSALEARVKSALAPNRSRTGVTSMDAFKIAFFGIAATAALALARPDIVQAQGAAVPPAPPAPVAAPAELPPPPPAVPAAPEAVPAPPAPPTMVTNADDEDDAAPVDRVVKVRETHHGHHRTVERTEHVIHVDSADPADRAEMARDQAEMRKAEVELDRIGPDVDRAIAEAKIDEKVAQAMRDVEPRIRAEVARAMAKARPEIRKAIADAHISEKVARALAEARPQIDAAIARAHDAHHHVRIEVHQDDEAPGKDDEQDDQHDDQ